MSSQRSPEEIIDLARREIEARRDDRRAAKIVRDSPWGPIFLGLLTLALVGLAFIPDMPVNMRLYAVVHGICAQEHNEFLGGVQLPLCARNTGIYGAFLLTILYLNLIGRGRAGKLPAWSISGVLAILVLLMAFDGFNSLFKDMGITYFYEPFNALRTLTGIGMGVAMGVFIKLIINTALRKDVRRDQQIVGGWLELVGAFALSLLLMVIIYGELTWGFWLVASVSFLGITGVLFMINTLVIALLMGYEASVTRWTQLARPATIALVVTFAMLGSLSWLRFWLETQGMMG